jgi:hypothetical protein
MMSQLKQLLDELSCALERLAKERGDEATVAFVQACGAMGRALVRNPQWRRRADLLDFIENSARRFYGFVHRLYHYHHLVFGALREDWYSEWIPWEKRNRRYAEVCRMWSDAVFMRYLYEGTDALEDFRSDKAGFFTREDDNFYELVRRGRLQAEVPPIEIPEDIPESHFWWWLPRDPSLGDDYV